jgi:hypothetical protein
MQDEMQEIRQACEGLEYPSVSDTPFDVFTWPAGGAGAAKDQVVAHGGARRKIEEVTPNDFFAELVEGDDGDRFRRLRATLESHLKDLRIFRVGDGEVKVDVYLVGRAASGAWGGVHTRSVET